MSIKLPRRIILTGGDYFICAIDRLMRRTGMPGNTCRLVIRLEGDLDVTRLRERLATSPVFEWIARVRMTRLLPVLSPRWRVMGAPPPGLLQVSAAGASPPGSPLPLLLPDRDLRADRHPALALDLLRGPDGVSHLVLSWHHTLMDARGAELLLSHLRAEPAPAAAALGALVGPAQIGRDPRRSWRAFPRKLLFARESLELVTATCREPFFTLTAAARPAARPRNEYRTHWFDAGETARIDEHARRLNAGFRRSHFYLAASALALHAVAAARGNTEGAYIVPVPHDLRRRGTDAPILSNHVSFLFFRIEPAQAGDLAALIPELTRQMMDQIRDRRPESFLAAMELFTPTPLDLYISQLTRPANGNLATFFFSDAGESCPGLVDVLGARPTAVTHLAPSVRPPGLTIVFSRFRGRLCFVLSWIDNCLSAREVDDLERGIGAALLGEGRP